MTEFTSKPERTYGLIVGIEEYHETTWNIKGGGPAIDALKFADWLYQRGVPKENIWLCLSPVEENTHLIQQYDFKPEPATEQNLFHIITNFLSQKQGDLLYFFWAGHGLMTSERDRRLICADATKWNWQNIDLNSLLIFLNSDAFLIRNHICIVDACANYVLESKGRPTNLGGKIFSSGQPRKDTQMFVLFATREGEQAKVNAQGKTGYLSQALQEALEQEPPEVWPPNMKAITEKIKQRFEILDKKQLPTYLYCRGWDSDTVVYRPNTSDVTHLDIPHNIPNSNACKFVGREPELKRLHQLLQENNIVAITDVMGQGGVGKTELAIEYSQQHLKDYLGGCCWLYPKGADLRTQLVEFAIVNFQNFSLPDDLSLAGQVSYCWRNWQLGNVLLVFDNVTDIQQIHPYLPSLSSQFKVLITTRQKSGLPYAQLPLNGLSPEAALELLAKLLGKEIVEREPEFAQKLCQLVNYRPLALYLIAAQCPEPGRNLC